MRLAWIVRPAVCARIVPRDCLYELLQGPLIARLLALANYSRHCEGMVKNEEALLKLPGQGWRVEIAPTKLQIYTTHSEERPGCP
jgi:hypothetical protein